MEQGFRAGLTLAIISVVGATTAWFLWPGGLVPIHFGPDGVANGFAIPVVGFFIWPGLILGFVGLVWLLSRREPNPENLARSMKAMNVAIVSVTGILLLIQVAVINIAFGGNVAIEKLAPFSVGMLLCVLGNYLPKVHRNWILGVRNRWTLSSDVVWRRTHRFSAPIFVAGGLALMIAPWAISPLAMRTFLFAIICFIVIIPTIYSYYIWGRSDRAD